MKEAKSADDGEDATDPADDEQLLALLAGQLPQPIALPPPPNRGDAPLAGLAASEIGTGLADAAATDAAATGVPPGTAAGFAEAQVAATTTAEGDLAAAIPGASALGALLPAAEAELDADLDATDVPATTASPATLAAAVASAVDRLHAAAPPPAAASVAAAPVATADAIERAVPLREVPQVLQSEVEGFLRMRGRGRHWEAEIRLDPPELGALHVRLELRGHALHGVVRVEDPALEPELARFLKDLEQNLRRQGGEASFDLDSGRDRGAWEEGERRAWSPSGDAPLGVSMGGGAGPGADRLVDLLA